MLFSFPQSSPQRSSLALSLLLHAVVAAGMLIGGVLIAPERLGFVLRPPGPARLVALTPPPRLEPPQAPRSPTRAPKPAAKPRPERALAPPDPPPTPQPIAAADETAPRIEPTSSEPPNLVAPLVPPLVAPRELRPVVPEAPVAGFETVASLQPTHSSSAARPTAESFEGIALSARPAATRTVLASAGFAGIGARAPGPSTHPRSASKTGFSGAALAGPAPGSPAPRENIKKTFGGVRRAEPSQRRAPTRPPAGLERTVLITFKPAPRYSDEARCLRVEGDVTLRISFGADGAVRVLSIVEGLGHGLDAMAIEAAQGIGFEPARSGGVPVDSTAAVRIRFQLAY